MKAFSINGIGGDEIDRMIAAEMSLFLLVSKIEKYLKTPESVIELRMAIAEAKGTLEPSGLNTCQMAGEL